MSTPEHGTHARYCTKGCRCWPCRKAHYDYNLTREKQIAYGRWQKFVPADPVREHVRSLMAADIGWRRVAQAAGVQVTSLNRILYVKPLQKRVSTDIAEKIMAVRPSLDLIGDTTAVDGTGTRRRLQALIAVGWSQTKLGAHLGIVQTNIGRVLTSQRVTAATARAVRDMYDKLWDTPVPEQDWRDKIAANRSRGYAAERSWAPPLAWDDETIDDPNARPHGVVHNPEGCDEESETVDLVAVERALEGDASVLLTKAERAEAVKFGTSRGMSARQISKITQRSARTVQRYRAEVAA